MTFERCTGGLAALIILAGLPAAAGEELAPEDGKRQDWFRSLMQPGKSGVSCCDISDCKRTVAKWQGDGWWAEVQGQWRSIPAESVLLTPRSIDGDAYVCSGRATRADRHFIEPMIYCFIPPDFGS